MRLLIGRRRALFIRWRRMPHATTQNVLVDRGSSGSFLSPSCKWLSEFNATGDIGWLRLGCTQLLIDDVCNQPSYHGTYYR
jgi:hypothetical protein